MKLKYLKDDELIYENKIMLIGITGHKIHTFGKIYATINMDFFHVHHKICILCGER